jgi:NAD(P)-dependent dehydrogenase (short-subunit alcohol dehydrogenase family)
MTDEYSNSPATGRFTLAGRTALLPGGYGEIGAAIATAFAEHGARVAIAGRDERKANALAERLRAAGHRAFGLALDATDVAAIEVAVGRAADELGSIDILMNCIGKNQEQKIAEVTEATFDDIYRTNLTSAMFLAQAVARRQLAAARGGKQIHLLSVRAQLGMARNGYSAYCASKGALVMLVKQHAGELAAHGICVNGIAPTVVATEAARSWFEDKARFQRLLERIPLGRVAQPADIAGAALFFASAASDFVTGQVLYLDGGLTATQ